MALNPRTKMKSTSNTRTRGGGYGNCASQSLIYLEPVGERSLSIRHRVRANARKFCCCFSVACCPWPYPFLFVRFFSELESALIGCDQWQICFCCAFLVARGPLPMALSVLVACRRPAAAGNLNCPSCPLWLRAFGLDLLLAFQITNYKLPDYRGPRHARAFCARGGGYQSLLFP